MPAEIPEHAQILVVGGGPGGSYTAAALAREGFNVVLLDMSKFPRYHIGESLLPSVRHYLRFIDAEEKVAAHGFARKPGSAIKFNQYMREGYTDFVALGAENSSWNVARSEFDALLLEHAQSCGAQVFTETRVETLQFAPPTPTPTRSASFSASSSRSTSRSRSDSTERIVDFGTLGRPVKASYSRTDGTSGEIAFDYLVDASGRYGLLSTKYLKNRTYNQSLKNVAVWGYWRGTGMYGKGTDRENAPYFEALSDESGWAWFIPLHNGLTSVGVVMEQKQHGVRSRAVSSATFAPLPASYAEPAPPRSRSAPTGARAHATLADRYLTFLHLAPGVQALIGDAATLERVEDEHGEAPAARSASDFSYSADAYGGVGWRLVGDAGAFIDPFFSSGVHLAMTGAVSAAATIAASIRGDCPEGEAAAWHSQRVAISYTRFLVVVLSAYKQIRAQSTHVLADIDEDNFDKAFAYFRPVIQGGAEMGTRLSEDEVQRALDFCVQLFSPTTPEQHESVRRKLHEAMLSEEDEDAHGGDARERLASGDSQASQASRSFAERLLDVRAPIVDPGALTRLLRSKLSLFRRNSSASITSVASVCSTASALSLRCASLPASPATGPSSPVSDVFSIGPRSASSASDAEDGDEDEREVRMVLDKVNARRVIHAEHGGGLNSLEQEALAGRVMRLVRGRLGLAPAGAPAGA
ncbi:FAD/NAD(P)-binding domain-containing protein [Phanerochaete sordida]|uniref:FAD/NAD(P)-binding domain-containing protein n=1 Tax=Phanerochaete sordida TaxID=48140 RepID=A0A9P3LEH3_9APHY|nr:FAD/NAD(P)-binding domain-containing protein [Phanerochaete sordida]